jgi:Asp-tRNA(Asn)/Glu-tRNA(Gln) amidotransferase A subunit family amidase
MDHPPTRSEVDERRRRLLKIVSLAGAGTAVFGRALVTLAGEGSEVTKEMIRQAEWVAGVEYTNDERELMLGGVEELLDAFEQLRAMELDNSVSPALLFRPLDATTADDTSPPRPALPSELSPGVRPSTEEDLAFAPVTELAALLRSRQISSVELTRMYLDRLKEFDPELECVIGYTEDLAFAQAERADREIAAGRWRGPLHGVPWGAKDLLAVPGYPTTWGAEPFRQQRLPEQATVAARLEQAGAVLVAKLTLGALAWGDVWFGGTTKNPWNAEQGSSGSSAGSSAATAAGLVAFAIGSETWGSIVSPCTRCGATGLRPTFGRVSRHGAMALSWSMDKLGPITRSVEDCALVFSAIQGPDGLDPTVVRRPFHWPLGRDVRTLRVGYVAEQFEEDRGEGVEDDEQRARLAEWRDYDLRTLQELEGLGLSPVPVKLPADLPVDALAFILTAEAAAAFDTLTRSGRDDELVRQIERAWPNTFRQGQLIPAVEYIRANRIRRLVMERFERVMDDIDLFVSPSFGGNTLLATNLTGHPQIVLPNGFRTSDGTPTSITFTGRLHGESELLAVAEAYQQATGYHLRRPPVGSGRSET